MKKLKRRTETSGSSHECRNAGQLRFKLIKLLAANSLHPQIKSSFVSTFSRYFFSDITTQHVTETENNKNTV